MDLQVVSSLSALPMVNLPLTKICSFYSDIKKNYSLANSVLTVVESNVSKASTVAAPYLQKYQPQIAKVDQIANDRVVKRLIDYCGPVVKKTPEELTTDTKKRVTDAVETVRHRAVKTKEQIVSAPAAGREMIVTKYHSAVELAGDKARKLGEVPANAREYIDSLWAQYGIQERYDQMWQIASSTTQRVREMPSNIAQRIPSTSDIVTPLRTRVEPYWNQTSKSFEATTERIAQSYQWMKESRLAAISTARELIDNSVGAVYEYGTDLARELSETYSKGSKSELLQVATRRLRTGRDVASQLARWTYGEIISLQNASTSVLDAIMSSWLFHWLSFQPILNRFHVDPETAPTSSAPFVPPVAGEPHDDDFEEYQEDDDD